VGLAHVRAEVGRSDAPLHSSFAPVADDPSVQIVSIAQTWSIAQMMVGTPHQGLPILAAAAPSPAGGRGGPEYFTDVPAVRINGALLREWLEGSAGLFNQITPGRPDRVLPNPEFPSCNFDGIGGGSCRIDLSQPVHYVNDGVLVNPDARRIVDRSCMGQPIDDAPEFVVAINNDRAGGGGLHRRGQGRDDRGRGRRTGRFRPLPHHAMAWAG
jgi:2',3'-cyclic-nucleotide 2'-phosphodiesterase/3'-nucleotidase